MYAFPSIPSRLLRAACTPPRQRLNLLHGRNIHDDRAGDADKTIGVELLRHGREGLAHQTGIRSVLQRNVITLGPHRQDVGYSDYQTLSIRKISIR